MMPKRILDGEGIWKSGKLAQVQSPEFRAEYPWLLPLALANGVFQCDPRSVFATSYSFNRPEISVEMVAKILDEFQRIGLLFRWQEPDGKWWGCWPELRKPGLLPSPSRKQHYECGPEPPPELLAQFKAAHVADGQPAVTQRADDDEKPNGQALVAAETPKHPADSPESLRGGSGNGEPPQHPLDEPGDLPLAFLAAHVAQVLGLPDSPQLRDNIAESIRSKAHKNGITAVAAHDRVLLEAAVDWQAGKPLFGCSGVASPRR
jgi:hypothetical protein